MLIESIDNNDRKMRLQNKLYQYLSSGEQKRRLSNLVSESEKFPKFEINLDSLRTEEPELATACIEQPMEMTEIAEKVISEILKDMQIAESANELETGIRIYFEGNLGKNTVTPRGLKSRLVNKLVKVQGIVISASKVRPRLLQSTHYCEKTNSFSQYQYLDQMGLRRNELEQDNFKDSVPLYDNENNPMQMEFGLCDYKDVQILQIQEMPENVPTGLLSRAVEVMVQEDLVDTAKPGDRVQIIGILRPGISGQTNTIGVFRTTLVATSVTTLTVVGETKLQPQELKEIIAVSKRPDILPLFIRSMAPAICGNEYIKEALLLLLLGGVEKELEGGTRLRGDINVLLVGDPSTGKSQFLRRVMNIANLAFSTTGRGSTGVGLTAAITVDKDTNERHLEAGAMVLADRGVICVDEFDKMSIEDRVAMHEVMEQQTVTIAKAGIHVSLNARCSVLAAANPLYGEYIMSKSASTNINLPDSLLSRFDLIFIMQDKKDPEHNRNVAQRVTANHRFQGAHVMLHNFNDGTGLIEPILLEDSSATVRPYEQFNPLLHESKRTEYLTQAFIKKYLGNAKAKKPKLSEDVCQFISSKWALLREIDSSPEMLEKNRILPITIRSLESLIRLSTAYAKLRLATEVSLVDCAHAFRIFFKAFYGGEDDFCKNFMRDIEKELNIKTDIEVDLTDSKHRLSRRRANHTAMEIENQQPPRQIIIENSEDSKPKPSQQGFTPMRPVVAKKEELSTLFKMLHKVICDYAEDSKRKRKRSNVKIDEFWEYVQANHPNLKFDSQQHYRQILEELREAGKIEIDHDVIYQI